jgi:succinoglycan biosynthesis transport protein ExoP
MIGDRSAHFPPTQIQRKSNLWSRLWRVPVVTLLCLIAGGVYIARANSIYTATAVLSIENLDLQQQRNLIRAAAAGVKDPTKKLGSELGVDIVPESNLIRLSFNAEDPKLAAQLVNGVVDAYVSQRPATAPSAKSPDPAAAKLSDEQHRKHKNLEEFKKANPGLSPDQEKAAGERLASLDVAATAAQIEATAAKSALDATLPMLQDPVKAQNLVDANRSKGIFDSLDRETNQIRTELSAALEILDQQKKTMLPQNPTRISTEKKVQEIQDRFTTQQQRYVDVYRTVLEQQWQTSLHKREDLQRTADQQREELKAIAAKVTRLRELESDLKDASAALARVTGQPADGDASEPGHVQIVQAAQAPTTPSWPDRTKVMWAALACGIIVGSLVSLIPVGDA